MQKVEPNEQTGAIQVMPTTVLGNNGQQIILQSIQQQLNANGQQQIQVLPILQGGSYIQVQPQASQPQFVQLPDGQTFIYHQPISIAAPQQTEASQAVQQQTQIVNINGQFYQIPAQQTITAQPTIQQQAAAQTTSAAAQPAPTQQVVMIPQQQQQQAQADNQISQNSASVNSNFSNDSMPSPPTQLSNSPTPTPVDSEDEPLYVNASEYRKSIKNSHPVAFVVFI